MKVSAGNLVQYDQRKGGMSYQSAQDPRLHFGLGRQTRVDAVEIRWSGGALTRLDNIGVDQVITVKEGAGIVPKEFQKVSKLKR